jgi:hypothetical protein
MTDESDTGGVTVFIVIGRGFREEAPPDDVGEADAEGIAINVLLTAEDEEDCIKRALGALAGQGFVRVELDRLGVLEGEPEDPTFASAYGNAIDGQVAVIAFHG